MGFFNFKKKKEKKTAVALPIPTHLQSVFYPVGDHNSEFEACGIVKCPCGSECFEVRESNEGQIINVVCEKCKNEFLLFDSGKHGWNGFVCGDDSLERELPLEQVLCSECGENTFGIMLRISSQGKEDFAEECSGNDPSFSPEDWVNAFEWINAALTCKKCKTIHHNWLDLETM